MRRATTPIITCTLAGLLLLSGCGSDDGGGVVTDLPTAGDVTGDTSGTGDAVPTEEATG